MKSDWPNLVRTVYLSIPLNRFEGVPYTEGGMVKLFGSYQQAYAFKATRPDLATAWVVEQTLSSWERVRAFERGE